MLIQILATYGREQEQVVSTLLSGIIAEQPRKEPAIKPENLVEAKKVAAEVARRLHLGNVLLQLMEDRDEEVRQTAVYAAFHLWEEDHRLGMDLLRRLGEPQALGRWLLPSRRRLRSCFELSMFVLFQGYSNPETTAPLREVWLGILGPMLGLQQTSDGSGRSVTARIAGAVRSVVLGIALEIVLAAASFLEGDEGVFDVQGMKAFFKSKEAKQLFAQVAPFINYNTHHLDRVEDQVIQLGLNDDLMSAILLLAVFGAHGVERPRETTPLIRKVFDAAIEAEACLVSLPILIVCLSNASDGLAGPKIDPDILALQEEMIVRYQEKHGSIYQGKGDRWVTYSGLSSYPQYAYRKYGKVNPEVLKAFIERAKDDRHTRNKERIEKGFVREKIHNYIHNAAVPGHPDYREMQPILATLEPVLDIAMSDPELEEELVQALAKIRIRDRDTVDYFMDERGIPRPWQERVRNNCAQQKMASAMIQLGIFFARDEILLKPDGQLSRIFCDWFEQAPKCNSLRKWVEYGLKQVLNALLDDELF